MLNVTRRSAVKLLGYSAASALFSGCGSGLLQVEQVTAYDLVIVGATVPGVMAAQIAAKTGAKVCLIENTHHLGGMLTNGGLGVTDSYHTSLMGGYTQKLFRDVAAYYKFPNVSAFYNCEPHVMEKILQGYLEGFPNVTVVFGRTLTSVSKTGTTIKSVTLDSDQVIAGTVWADTSYEGDLMALSGASFASGREGRSIYGESAAGFYITAASPVDPYLQGTQVIPYVNPSSTVARGTADSKVAAYCYRVCVTKNKSNGIPFTAPANYNPDQFTGLLRTIKDSNITSHRYLFSSGYLPDSLTGKSGVKFSLESNGLFSLDCPAFGSWRYPNAAWPDRQAIVSDHKTYTQSFFYFLANDSSVPLSIRDDVSSYSLAADEFTDNGGFPIQLYVREGRRLIGQYVMTQDDVTGVKPGKSSTVGIGQWPIDCHPCDRLASADGSSIAIDGSLEVNSYVPYQMPFECAVPNPAEVSNLMVGICLSSSHVGWSAIRTEPTLSIMGEAIGYAAVQLLQSGKAVVDTDISSLQSALTSNGSILQA